MGRKGPTQKQIADQAKVLRYIEEACIASAGDVWKHYGNELNADYTLSSLYRAGRLIRAIMPTKRPKGWKGPHLRFVFYYIPDTEKEVAGKMIEWLPAVPEGGNVALSHMNMYRLIEDFPGSLQEHLRRAYDRRLKSEGHCFRNDGKAFK